MPYGSKSFSSGIVLSDAYSVKVTEEINGTRMLEFSHPINDKAELICENKIVACEEQAYRIVKVVRSRGEKNIIEAECSHVYNADAANIHIQNIPDMIGVSPTEVLEKAFENTSFSFFTDSELEELGMKRVDYDGFLIDFFSTDKTNPYDVVKSVIENCGKGELYADNYKIALVERIGKQSKLRLELTKNMQNISIERDITDMVTRLYPYGKDDAHIGSVNNDVQYIESENISSYGVREGYRDYSDYTDPQKIMERAMWEFDSENEERIDVPSINITGTFADISKLSEYEEDEKVSIGDSVAVIDNGNEIDERVIRVEYYPYENENTVISIGRVKKDLFFYLDQMGTLTRRYDKVSTSSGKVKATAVSGVIENSGLIMQNASGSLTIVTDRMEISYGGNKKTSIGNKDGVFMFTVTDNAGNKAMEIGTDGKMDFTGDLTAQKITVGGKVISVNSSGNLTIDGNEIKTG
jgi:phage minor structural protein